MNKRSGIPIALISIFRESLIGGISVHSSSLFDRLVENKENVVKVNYAEVFQQQTLAKKLLAGVSMGVRLLKLRFSGIRIFHFHASNQALVFYLFAPVLYLMGGRIILSIHSGYGYDKWLDEHPGYDNLNQVAFRCLDRLIFMNPEESTRIRLRYPFLRKRVATVNPFIAPAASSLPKMQSVVCEKNNFCIATIGAWGARYNVEEAVEAAAILSERIEESISVTVIQSTSLLETSYKQRVLDRFAILSDRLDITVVEDSSAILDLLARHDVFVRPSKGDSYGLCVAEALLVGTPAIATDVCRRCEGTLLYRQGDTEALVAHLRTVYAASSRVRKSLLDPSQDSYAGYLKEYQALI
ncbi:glycosyltransferase family 4 protein [Neolewinella antarctica]|uniref:Glycosyltransferase involved in cell wall biosynthesis n=1 Tax=Neolewinella antarctica TaxID=442734 RepID=A0ABX0XAY1_9BACT|nr:glycosyltransferase family 4 protein [Neolewinella antarctica]NJC26121.1 glycosyltransferase involved in cell wall biosynthesis [Neolewinella antarctica]